MSASLRSIRKIVQGVKTQEGAGFIVERPFPGRVEMEEADPFLLFDHFGPVSYGPGEAKGAPWHPHRGFETVTYVLQGEMQHRDSMGNHGSLRAGDVQWMTAGSGIIHDEEPSDEMKKKGGSMEGFQVWVNLPRAQKMTEPKYQDISREKIPEVKMDKLSARVIAGTAFGVKGAVATSQPINYIDFQTEKGADFVHVVPPELNNGFVFVYRGSGYFGRDKKSVKEGECGFIDDVGTELQVQIAAEGGCKFLFCAGQRLNEPIAHMGPFVMNSEDEVRQAYHDYREGKFVRKSAKFESKAEHKDVYDPAKATIV